MKKAVLILLFSQFCIAQHGIIWQKTLGGNQIDGFSSCIVGVDFGFLVGGTSNSGIDGDKNQVSRGSTDPWLIKFSENGLIQWQKTIGGSGSDALNQIINDENGYFLACTSSSNISGEKTENRRGLSDYWIIRINNLGNIISQKTIGGDRNDVLTSLIKTNNGLVLAGFSDSAISGEKTENRRGVIGENDFWIVNIDNNYNILWQRTFGGSLNDRLYNIIPTLDGGFLLAGDSNSSISADKTETNFGDYDIWLVKISNIGNIEWQKTLGGSQTEVFGDILQTDDGGFLVGCYSNSSISGNKTENTKGLNDYWVIKLSESGTIEWQKVIGGNDQDNLTSLTKNGQGYVLGGSSKSNFSGDKNSFSRGLEDFWVVMIDFDGNIIGQKTIGGELYDGIENMLVDGNGSIFLGGNSLSSIVGEKTEVNRGGSDYWVMLLEPNALSLDSTLFSEIKVFPNPTNKILDFRFPTPFTGKIVQTDSLGKVIQTLEIKNQVNFSTEVLGSDGIYFFTIENENGLSKTIKIVKQE
jgi:hypothetical protein